MKQRHHLRSLIVLLALTPGVVCALAIGLYLTYALMRDITLYEMEMGNAYGEQLGLQNYTAVRGNDVVALEKTAQMALEYPLLRAITFYGADRHELAHAGPRHEVVTDNENVSNWLGDKLLSRDMDTCRQVFVPVTTPRLSGRATDGGSEAVAGWIQLEFSSSFMMLHKYRTVLIDTVIVLITLACTFWIALPFGDDLANALRKMAMAARAIGRGDPQASLPASQVIELQDLAGALGDMQSSAADQQANLQQHIEQSTQDLRETLETIEIQNIELDLARREAVQASRIKSEFLANTSHEIRTPLNSIIGFSKLLLKTPLSTQQHDYLQNIRKSSENLLTIINDVLDLSKIEAGRLVLDYVPFSIHQTVEEVLQILAPGAHEKGLELLHMIYSDVPRQLLGDPLRLKQVLTNLVSNAVKFSEQGNVVVRIATETLDSQQTLLKIEVNDSGKGLPNDSPVIFNAFTQLDSSSTREYAGTGLGLAISRKIVEQMGGDIGYTSQPGDTTFWFTVRFDIARQTETEECTLLNGRHVLVFDQERLCRLATSHSLTNWGVQPILADALAQIAPSLEHYRGSEHPVEAVLLGLPVRHQNDDARSLLATAESLLAQFACPVLLCIPTGARQELPEDKLPRGIRLLQKPVTEDRLYQTLTEVLGLSTAGQEHVDGAVSQTESSDVLHVLAVDDNASNLKLITAMLGDLGVIVYQAANGEEAVQVFREHRARICLIFMDVQMPVMDGIDATQRIRQLEAGSGKHTPIIALTAHAMAEQRQQMLMAGMDDYLSKPATDAQLQQMLARWCSGAESSGSLRQSITDNRQIPSVIPRTVVDADAALQASGQRIAIAADMLETLLASLESDRDQIHTALREKNYQAAETLVHKLHGACCYCGVTELKNTCNAMETLLRKELTDLLPDAVTRFDQAVQSLLAWRHANNPLSFLQAKAGNTP